MDISALSIIGLLSVSAVESYMCYLGKFPNNCKCYDVYPDKHTIYLDCTITNASQFINMTQQEYGPHISSLVIYLQKIEFLPSRAFEYRNLASLNISSDGYLKALSSDVFRGLRNNLRVLSLTGTKIEVVPVDAIQNLSRLNFLDLRNSAIKSLDARLHKMVLFQLILQGNRISEIGSEILPVSLRYLDLGGNGITSISEALRESFPFLDTLKVSSNKITSIGDELRNTPNLKSLHADINSIEGLENGALRNVPKLLKLHLNFNLIQVIYNGLKGLQNLQELYIGNNRIEYLHATAFNDLQNLKILDLSENKLRFIQEDTFDCLTSLQTFFIVDNRLAELKFLRDPRDAILFGQGRDDCTFRDYAELKWIHINKSGVICDNDNKEILQYVTSRNVDVIGNPCLEQFKQEEPTSFNTN